MRLESEVWSMISNYFNTFLYCIDFLDISVNKKG